MNQDCKIYNGNWYKDPEVYNKFSKAEDKNEVCFKIVSDILRDEKIHNPIDLCSGTGRVIDYLLTESYTGMIYGIEKSNEMCEFLEKKYDWQVVIIKTPTEELLNHPLRNNIKSSLVISRFGFPSKIWDKKLAWEELIAVESLLAKDGLFITLGWDEDFNDELNEMWYRFVPDGLQAKNFDEWKKERKSSITSTRNAHLTIYKKNINTSLQFNSLQESAYIMGTLFGERALQYIVKDNKTNWEMKMSITVDTKESIKKILKKYERT